MESALRRWVLIVYQQAHCHCQGPADWVLMASSQLKLQRELQGSVDIWTPAPRVDTSMAADKLRTVQLLTF